MSASASKINSPPLTSKVPVVLKLPFTVKAPDVALSAVIDKGRVIHALFAEFLNFNKLFVVSIHHS